MKKINDDYSVTEDGKVFSHISNKYLKQLDNGYGYKNVSLRGKRMYVHRLVAQAYVDNPNQYLEINHIDGNKSNNHYTNLEWCTRKQNRQHAVEHGLWVSPRAMTGRKGADNPHSKPVMQFDMNWNYIQTFPGVKEAARQLGYKSPSQITNMILGKSKSSGGFKWKYKEELQ